MFSDLDMNNHITSMRYLDWAADTFDYEYLNTHLVQSVDINFNHELPINTETTLLRQQTNDNEFIVNGVNNNRLAFAVKMRFV